MHCNANNSIFSMKIAFAQRSYLQTCQNCMSHTYIMSQFTWNFTENNTFEGSAWSEAIKDLSPTCTKGECRFCSLLSGGWAR